MFSGAFFGLGFRFFDGDERRVRRESVHGAAAAGSNTVMFPEFLAEEIAVVKTAGSRDLGNGTVGMNQLIDGMTETEADQVFDRRTAGRQLETAEEIAPGHVRQPDQRFDPDFFRKMPVHVGD